MREAIANVALLRINYNFMCLFAYKLRAFQNSTNHKIYNQNVSLGYS